MIVGVRSDSGESRTKCAPLSKRVMVLEAREQDWTVRNDLQTFLQTCNTNTLQLQLLSLLDEVRRLMEALIIQKIMKHLISLAPGGLRASVALLFRVPAPGPGHGPGPAVIPLRSDSLNVRTAACWAPLVSPYMDPGMNFSHRLGLFTQFTTSLVFF